MAQWNRRNLSPGHSVAGLWGDVRGSPATPEDAVPDGAQPKRNTHLILIVAAKHPEVHFAHSIQKLAVFISSSITFQGVVSSPCLPSWHYSRSTRPCPQAGQALLLVLTPSSLSVSKVRREGHGGKTEFKEMLKRCVFVRNGFGYEN